MTETDPRFRTVAESIAPLVLPVPVSGNRNDEAATSERLSIPERNDLLTRATP
jgi:hypothetical protein